MSAFVPFRPVRRGREASNLEARSDVKFVTVSYALVACVDYIPVRVEIDGSADETAVSTDEWPPNEGNAP